jgi:predicted nucleotidyltransferase component of viral defense system
MIQEWFDSYNCKNQDDILKAKTEIIQHIVLAALSRSDFFEKGAFYGGTALRLLYQLPRYSEDIDFSLHSRDDNFTLENYFNFIEQECKLHNLDVDLKVKKKVNVNSVESAFLKDKTEWNIITFLDKKDRLDAEVKVKIEIDRSPPEYFETEQKLLIKPFSFYITTYKQEYLFAGKMHALLFREWKTRVKGRDWYDMEWYIKRGTKLDIRHLQERAHQSGHLDLNVKLNENTFLKLLKSKIENLNLESALFDIQRFVMNPQDLKIWSKQYFHDLATMIKFI